MIGELNLCGGIDRRSFHWKQVSMTVTADTKTDLATNHVSLPISCVSTRVRRKNVELCSL